MTGKELWDIFIKKSNLDNYDYETWTFGVDADLLAHLVAIGEKTATAQHTLYTNWKMSRYLKLGSIMLFWIQKIMLFALFKQKK